jgi:hypothetical protein
VPLKGLNQWIRIRQALRGMSQLRDFGTISMSPEEALIDLRFAGTIAELRRQLEQKGMKLTPDPASATGPGTGPGGREVWLLQVPDVIETKLPPAQGASPGAPPAPGGTPDGAPGGTPGGTPDKGEGLH